MGSGVSGLYSGTYGSSQPYAEKYHVLKKMVDADKDAGIYGSNGYSRNPNAQRLDESIRDGHVYLKNGNIANGKITYVLDAEGNIIIGARDKSVPQRSPHPRLLGGRDPKAQCAGMISFRKGRIAAIDNQSGHYRPNAMSMSKVYAALDRLPSTLFTNDFKREGRR